ncbi:MAG: DUF4173 domain-containing protein [Chloroflexi bacterium]|nr:DUF4173 domain-containing protein [Chloroflexota bacterium]
MRDQTRLGLFALATAAVLGLLGDLLLRVSPWGVNAPLFILALVTGAGVLVSLARLPLLGEGRWLALLALLFSAGIALRDSEALTAVNVLAVLLTIGLAAHRAPGGWPFIGGLPQFVGGLVSAGFHACGGVLVLLGFDIHWREVPRTGWPAVVLAVLRGLLIAIPLLLVFGGLFMAADAVFSGIVTKVLNINLRDMFGHIFWSCVWTWLTAGFLRQALFCTVAIDGLGTKPVSPPVEADSEGLPVPAPSPVGNDLTPQPPLRVGEGEMLLSAPRSPGGSGAGGEGESHSEGLPAPAAKSARPPRPGGRVGFLGIVELSVVLGLLDLLFLAFVIVQFRYLFGGAALVEVSPTLTFSEYARRGFFELVTVAALLLGIMLFLDWLARLDTPVHTLVYRVLAGLLVALLAVVIVSALQRMRLYTLELGLTELRLYTTAFMLWIAAGAVWFLATVLRDHRQRFLFGASMAGLGVALILNLINPDDLIVRTNAARHDAPARFDGSYTLGLSSDATPALLDVLDAVPAQQRDLIARRLIARWRAAQNQDWRSWNYGRWRAWTLTAANEERLRGLAGPPNTNPSQPNGRLDIPGPSDP